MKKGNYLTIGEFARAVGAPYQTVVGWAKQGVIPGIRREETPRGPVWLIPPKALDTIQTWRPSRGRPPKAKPVRKGTAETGAE